MELMTESILALEKLTEKQAEAKYEQTKVEAFLAPTFLSF